MDIKTQSKAFDKSLKMNLERIILKMKTAKHLQGES